MDDSPQIPGPTLNPSQTAMSFPAYRRRPIRSLTCQSLLQILPVASFQETMAAGREIGVISHNDVNRKESEDNASFQETFTGKSKKVVVSEDTNCGVKQTAGLKLGQVNVAMNGGQIDSQMGTGNVQDYMATENQSGNTDIRIKNDREKMKCVNPVPVDDFDPFELLMADEDFSIEDFSEVLDSCFELEMADKPSQDGGNDQKNVSTFRENMPKEVELQMTEMELEKLINNLGVVESSSGPTFDNEIEEGEISEDAMIGDVSLDALSEDIVLREEKSTNLVHTTVCYQEDFALDEERGPEQHYSRDSSLVNRVSKGKRNVKVETRTAPDYNFIYGFRESSTNVQTAGLVAGSPVASGRILQDRADKNQISLSNREDGNTNKKKRKKGPMTEERKAKKKKKDRKKRAEKNRELGVKRLKLPTVLKPKKITYCRHYMQGRCHEGEQCKFSHDSVPLTKSKPCGYFARNSCMKGDDCPFDHELSKYPCNNYATTGFCSKDPHNQGHTVTPNASKPKLMSEQQMIRKDVSLVAPKLSKPMAFLPSPQNGSNSSRHSDNHGNKTDVKFQSIAQNSSCSGAEQLAPKSAAWPPPKGIKFLLNEQTPLSDVVKHKQDAPSVKASGVVDAAAHEQMLKVPRRINKSNGKSDLKRPRGINFLTFAQPFSDDSTSKILGNLLSSSSTESGKLVTGDLNQHASSLSPETDRQLNYNILMNESANSSVPNPSGKSSITPLASSQHLSVLSFNKIRIDGSVKENDTPPSLGRVSKITLDDKIQTPSTSSRGPSWDQLTNTQNANLLSTFKPSSVQEAVQSTLAFAEKFDACVKLGSSHQQG